MIKIEITFEHYLNAIVSELKKRLSTDCNIRIVRDDFRLAPPIRSLAKEYPELDYIRLDWSNWHYMIDTMKIERDYIEAHSVNYVADVIIEQIKTEFVKQVMI